MWRISHYFHKINNLLNLCIFFPLSFIFFLVIILIKPLLQIRISKFRSDKIGHLSIDYELYLEEKKQKINIPKGKYLDIWCKNTVINNHYLYNIRKNQINLVTNLIFEGVLILIKLFKLKNFIIERQNPDADIYYVLDSTKSSLNFEKEKAEELEYKCEKILESNGYNKNTKIVLLNIRDSAFRGKSSYTDYRNIYNHDNYNDTIKFLLENNYFVIRVGIKVNHKFNFHENFIDYPFSKFKSDEMDLYMAKKCNFCISTGTGIDALVRSYRNPVLFTNFVPHGYFNSYGKKNITIFKHMIDNKGNKISLNKMLDMNLIINLDGNKFVEQKIKFLENSPNEILLATKSMINHINNNFQKKEDKFDKFIEEIFINKISKKYVSPKHKIINSSICPEYLSFNKYLFDL